MKRRAEQPELLRNPSSVIEDNSFFAVYRELIADKPIESSVEELGVVG